MRSSRHASFPCCFAAALNRTPIRRRRRNKLPFAGVKLKLQVVDDPEMAKAIERLRGEWSTQSGSDFEIIQTGEKELSEVEEPFGRRGDLLLPTVGRAGREETAGRGARENPEQPELVGSFRVAQDSRGGLGGKNLRPALRFAGVYDLLPRRSA